ncbi:YceD family protein [Lactococcus fujiensis]|uniref:DNA-binding protein n=1 Tax=Lactococcus fujiensis JCM 16395 TaxID=1291764 RepID=A0A2A5RQ53_9LACT|nr:YceD family protein [Lactococcus fujiensis]PCS01573.1 hypothetical protein RT41_GL000337 [Lactococcus fujiensis JCM 16395]
MKWSTNEITKKKSIDFDETLELSESLSQRSSEILNATPIHVFGQISYDNGLYLLDYQLDTVLTLPSSRSLKPVEYPMTSFVNESFASPEFLNSSTDLLDSDLIIPLDKDLISLDESVEDNILLEIPLQVLSDEEKEISELPAGQHWTVLSEDDYQAKQVEKKEEKKSPFADLDGLFD